MSQWVVPPVAMISKLTEMLREIKLAINSGKLTRFSSISSKKYCVTVLTHKSMLQRDLMEDETAIIIDMESETYSDSGLSAFISHITHITHII